MKDKVICIKDYLNIHNIGTIYECNQGLLLYGNELIIGIRVRTLFLLEKHNDLPYIPLFHEYFIHLSDNRNNKIDSLLSHISN